MATSIIKCQAETSSAPVVDREADLLDGDSLFCLRCGILESYLDDGKIGLLMYADNRTEEYIGRKIGRISRLISRKFSVRLMREVA